VEAVRIVLSPPVVAVNAAIVATVAAVVAIASWRAMVRTGNRHIGFVVGAFALLALKGVAKAYVLAGGEGETTEMEFVFSLVDLAVVGLVAWPLLLSRRGGWT
jgi:hypothetical protein